MHVQDRAHEFRIVIEGKFTGSAIRRVADLWETAVNEALPRRIVVDISAMTECDSDGLRLLRDMHRHGTDLAGKTPLSLVFLAQATDNRRPKIAVLPAPERRPALKAVAGR